MKIKVTNKKTSVATKNTTYLLGEGVFHGRDTRKEKRAR